MEATFDDYFFDGRNECRTVYWIVRLLNRRTQDMQTVADGRAIFAR